MKQILFLLFFGLFTVLAPAQDMVKVFTSMPDSCIPQLEEAWRKDMVDLFKAGKEARLKNTMNGSSVLTKLTGDYLSLQVTERSTIELKLLPLVNDTYIICMVTTVNGPVADSRVAFYTTDWKPLPSQDLLIPVKGDWFLQAAVDTTQSDYQTAVSRLDMELIQYSLSPDNLTLTATYTTPLYLGEEDRKMVTPFLKESPKVYQWKSTRFE